jgi:hypothetical protein
MDLYLPNILLTDSLGSRRCHADWHFTLPQGRLVFGRPSLYTLRQLSVHNLNHIDIMPLLSKTSRRRKRRNNWTSTEDCVLKKKWSIDVWW